MISPIWDENFWENFLSVEKFKKLNLKMVNLSAMKQIRDFFLKKING